MGMQVVQVDSRVDEMEQIRYGSDPVFQGHLRATAARQIAELIVRDAVRHRVIPPAEIEERNPLAVPMAYRHLWRFGVETNLSEVEVREKQMDEARRDGLRQAAKLLAESAVRYRGLDGSCAHVLEHELASQANRMLSLANS